MRFFTLLIPLALALALPAGFVQAAGVELDGGYGEKRYRPSSVAELRDRYEMAAGELTIDLRDVDLPAGDRPLRLELGMGEAEVIVPDDVCVATRAEVGMGEVRLFGDRSGGVDVDLHDAPPAPAGTARLVIDADVGLGELRVRDESEQERSWRERWDDDRDDDANRACA